jgi:hypothetical protein
MTYALSLRLMSFQVYFVLMSQIESEVEFRAKKSVLTAHSIGIKNLYVLNYYILLIISFFGA